jgi:hypothetical protein
MVNGYVTFGYPYLDPIPRLSPLRLNAAIIYPWWADIDLNYGSGTIYYQEYIRLSDDISINPLFGSEKIVFSLADDHAHNVLGDTGFYATNVVIITWQGVSPYPSSITGILKEVKFHNFGSLLSWIYSALNLLNEKVGLCNVLCVCEVVCTYVHAEVFGLKAAAAIRFLSSS